LTNCLKFSTPCLLLLAVFGFAPHTQADSASDVHERLSSRWYVTEIIVFRYLNEASGAPEQLLYNAHRQQTRLQGDAAAAAAAEATRIELLKPQRIRQQQTASLAGGLDAGVDQTPVPLSARLALELEELAATSGVTVSDIEAVFQRNIETFEADLARANRVWLAEEDLYLSEQASRIAGSRSMQLLLHGGWLQAVPARDAPQQMQIAIGTPRQFGPHSVSTLEGSFSITIGRYLHVQTQLYYYSNLELANLNLQSDQIFNPTTPVEFDALDTPYPPYIELSQARRLRSGELHYIDHPQLGVLVKIVPVPIPQLLQDQVGLLE
jgi:hypothetical protein